MTTFDVAGHSQWPAVRPWIENACTKGDGWWTIGALENLLADGKAALWVLSDDTGPIAAVVTTICDWDGDKVAEIVITGGEGILENAPEHFGKIDAWARALGAVEIVMRGRRGWARALKPHGYEEIAVTMRKAL